MRIRYAHQEGAGMRRSDTIRQPANLSIDSRLMKEAKALRVNVSRAAEAGIAEAVRSERSRLWKMENRAALEAWNEYFERHPPPELRPS
jgi:antitoxin CcdA